MNRSLIHKFILVLWVGRVISNPGGAPNCGAPEHGTSNSAASGVAISLSGSTVTLTANTFRGFLLTTNAGLIWSGGSSGTKTSTACGGGNTALTQTSGSNKSSVSATISCASNPGLQFTITAYIVYKYETNYQTFTQAFVCSGSSTTTASPSGVITTLSTAGVSTSLAATTVRPPGVITTFPGVSSTSSSTNAPVVASTTTVPSGHVTVTTTIPPSGAAGSVTSLGGMIAFSWSLPVSGGRRLSVGSPSSEISLNFDTGGESPGWIGMGFGYDNYLMTGSKKTVTVELSDDGLSCVAKYYLLVDRNVREVVGLDPWKVQASACVVANSVAAVTFTIGGDSSVILPAAGSSVYVLLAGGRGVGLSNHGSNWDYKQVDFLSIDSSGSAQNSGNDNSTINPFYLSHGVIFITVFAILMPLTSFLILVNKARFLGVHKWLGGLIVLCLIGGWVVLNWTDDNLGYSPLNASSAWGNDHSDFGSYGVYAASGVCAFGVILWTIGMPVKVKLVVRWIHGIAGVMLSFYGPMVVWTGWLRLAPLVPPIDALDSSPFVWLSVGFAFALIFVVHWLIFGTSGKRRGGNRKSFANEAEFTRPEVDSLVKAGKLILLVDKRICVIPKSFVHPGGKAVLKHYSGQEVGHIMRGELAGKVNGRNRVVPHSSYAFELLKKMRIGHLVETGEKTGDLVKVVVVPPAEELAPITPINHRERTIGTLVSFERLNLCVDFPVRMFKVRVQVLSDLGPVQRGSRIYMSVQDEQKNRIERPYTVVHVNEKEHTIDFAIKIYPGGQLTSRLQWLKPGDCVSLSHAVPHPGIPSGTAFVVFLAGGTGITPMFSYFKECAEKTALGGVLLWWVRNEDDLFLLDELGKMAGTTIRIQIYTTQQQPAAIVVGGSVKRRSSFDAASIPRFAGRLTQSSILNAIGDAPLRETSVIMSGPEGFVQSASETVQAIGIPEQRVVSLD